MAFLSKLALSSIRNTHRAWPMKLGKELPARAGAFAAKRGFLKAEWFEFQPGLWMKLNVGDMIQETILLEGVWDPALTAMIQSTLKPGDVFLDVGAHAGYCTLLAAKQVGPTGVVLACEPNPASVRQLEANIERSRLGNVIVESTAIGDSTDPVTLFLNAESNSGMASLSKANVSGNTGLSVQCAPLDELVRKHGIERADLVKIDVEGAEMLVLRGMKDILRRLRPTVVLELEPHLLSSFGVTVSDVTQFLEDVDYSVSSLGMHSNFIGRPKAAALSNRY